MVGCDLLTVVQRDTVTGASVVLEDVGSKTMQAIETKYLGPTNTKSSRITARCEAGHITSTSHHNRATNVEDDHRWAAIELITKLGWFGHWVQGAVPSNNKGYVFVCYQRYEYDNKNGVQWKSPAEGFDVYPVGK